eukprot:g31139.t1
MTDCYAIGFATRKKPGFSFGASSVPTLSRLKKNDSVLSTFTLDIQGEEPDLSELLERLQQMNAQALREVFQKADTEDQQLAVVKVFAQMDKNSDGKIHCGEFVSYILEGKRPLGRNEEPPTTLTPRSASSESSNLTDFDRQMLRQTFAKVDRNQDGAVSLVELAELYGKEPTFRTGRHAARLQRPEPKDPITVLACHHLHASARFRCGTSGRHGTGCFSSVTRPTSMQGSDPGRGSTLSPLGGGAAPAASRRPNRRAPGNGTDSLGLRAVQEQRKQESPG